MALIGTIRNNGWILIALMVLALGGFIIMDIMSNARNYRSGDANTVGKINGQVIERSELEQADKLLFRDQAENDAQGRQLAWTYLVEKGIVEKEAAELGLGVGTDELKQIMFGPENLSQVVAQKYTNRQTRQVDYQTIGQIKQAIEGGQELNANFREYWSALEKEASKDRLQRKLLNLVFKGIYTPKWQLESAYNEANLRGDFLFVKVPYEKISDDEAKPTDADFQAFYDEAKETFRATEELRFVDYFAMDVKPSKEDTAAIIKGLADNVEGFKASTNDSIFCLTRNGVYNGNQYFKKAELGDAADQLLAAPIGSVVGPYFSAAQNQYRISKILDKKAYPDSAKARHILISAKSPAEFTQAGKTIDSLMGLIQKGMRFDSLAKKFSQDPGSAAKGGDLGYFAPGTMVPEFNAVSCFTGEIGKLYKVKTQFGVHLIQPMDRKYGKEQGLKMAYLATPLEPSETTQAAVKEKAQQLATKAKNGDELKKEVEAMGGKIFSTNGLRAAEYNQNMVNALGSSDAVRDMSRWAFNSETKKGAVSSEVFAVRDPNGGFYDAKYIVASLKSILPKGLANWQDVRTQIEQPVKNRKKAEVIKAKINGSTDLASIANQFGVAIDTALGASFAAGQIAKVGQEPKVSGNFALLDAGQTSKPIDGTAGVFVLNMLSKTPPAPAPADLTMMRRATVGRIQYDINNNMMKALQKSANLTDNRASHY